MGLMRTIMMIMMRFYDSLFNGERAYYTTNIIIRGDEISSDAGPPYPPHTPPVSPKSYASYLPRLR